MYNKTVVVTYNVNGISNKKKRNAVFKWLKTQSADISMLQEIHYKSLDKEKWKKDWNIGEIICSGNSSNQAGVAILIKNSFNIKIVTVYQN